MSKYVHGYSDRESRRLHDQADTLDELLHHDSIFSEGSKVLEVGCGVGSQTKIIAKKNPACEFTSVDISETSLEKARNSICKLGINNVTFQVGDIFDLQFGPESFDHIFVCFVLEHLSNPLGALLNLKNVLRKDGTIMVVEGDHGSAYYYPRSDAAQEAIDCQVKLQSKHGGNALIGRELYPLLRKAGFAHCTVTPRLVYVDSSKPRLVDGFIRNTFTAMIEGVKEEAISNSLIGEGRWEQGINDLYRTTKDDGVFCYTFFKGKGTKTRNP
ncbi:MAG TPA: class I SAM-dependent methyltransferase [Candidatus Acidoferrales bacterium]|nr:class I SAM-dependent methyltransferase [Candidatus Acidoferrales bacterium]